MALAPAAAKASLWIGDPSSSPWRSCWLGWVFGNLNGHVTGPMRDRMGTVEDFVADTKAAAKACAHWLNRLWPAFYAGAGVAIYVAAQNVNDILKALSTKWLYPVSSSS